MEINGQYMGVTPLYLTYDKSFFEGHGDWVWSRYLSEPISMSVSADGCAPQGIDLTRGPYNWQNAFGNVSVNYYVFTSYEYNVQLNCSGSAPGAQPYGGSGYGGSGQSPSASSYAAPPSDSSGSVMLQIQSTQGSLINDAQRGAAIYCLSHRLVLVQASSTMDLEVQIAGRTLTFRQNDVKSLQVPAGAQDYSISGKITMTFGAMAQRGGGMSTINATYDFSGDGTLNLSPNDAGRVVRAALTQTNSQVSSMDLSSGEAEGQITLALSR